MKVTMREGYRWQPRRWQPNAREKAILDGLVGGKTNAAIGAELGISGDGVKWYVSQLLDETGFANRRELAGWWARPKDAATEVEFHGPTMFLSSSIRNQKWTSEADVARLSRPGGEGNVTSI